ncbi:DedA family protein [Streptomyces sp. PSAA01]|uniref:DedA family protein n=1 Tax=Streptomyces sp. PSAA01 TaxID=2912762 RepID=UPI001F3788A5|nr:VTT domain-containing protein [Streptomyces sp. PSAA01]MCG0286822.1 VTT domain-containing protein [Streptomyces sp. PSAA01]
MEQWLLTLPPALVCASLALTIALQYVCLPAPGGIAMTTAALLTVDGPIHPAAAVLAATAGAVAGGAMGHRLGNRAGRALVQGLAERKRGPFTPSRISSLERLTERRGLWAVAAAPFSAMLRNTIAPVCGTLGTKRLPFLCVTAVGVAAWATANIIAVQLLGEAAEKWISALTALGLGALFVAVLATGIRAAIRLRHHRAHAVKGQ